MKALILAGGYATRLWPLTEKRAKPLLLLDGKTVFERILDTIPESVELFVLTNSVFGPDFEQELTRIGRTAHIFLEDSVCDGEKLGALRAVSEAINAYNIQDDIAILAGDNILDGFQWDMLSVAPSGARVLLQDIGDLFAARRFGVATLEGNTVTQFIEKPQDPPSTLVSTGFFALGAHTLPHLHACARIAPDNLGGVVSYLLDHHVPVQGTVFDGQWFDVGNFDTYLEAHKALLGPQAAPHPTNTITGQVYIAPGADVQHSHLHDCIVYAGATIHGCRLTHTVVDEATSLHNVDLSHMLVRRGTHAGTPS